MYLFNGYQQATLREQKLSEQVQALNINGQTIAIGAILFVEDQGSQLYTRLKKEAAERIGIQYVVAEFSMRDESEKIKQTIEKWNNDPNITGIIIQKPWRKTWMDVLGNGVTAQDFQNWWQSLTASLNLAKDVDGLQPGTLTAIQQGTWKNQQLVLPATCQAVISILDQAFAQLNRSAGKVIILGKSDLLGQPLFFVLKERGLDTQLLGTQELKNRMENKSYLLDADVVVSATGQAGLVTGDMIKEGAIVIDVGEPKPDVEVVSVSAKAAFLTPVPGGVGPMTVICLLENAVKLAQKT